MGETLGRKATYEDLEQVPPEYVGELVGGTLYVSPRPASPHTRAAARLLLKLGRPFDLGEDGPGGWILLPEPRLRLGGDGLVPDLAGWRRERMPEMPEVPAFTTAPDWVCEVLSPSTEVLDREVKAEIYAREGVQHLWLVEPVARTLEVYRREGLRWVSVGSHAGAARVRAEPFSAAELDLGLLWAR
jgi:Uma2 family endonuclease